MEKFEDLKFHKFMDGIAASAIYGEYELSVVRHSSSYGSDGGLYEIAVFKGDGMVEMPGITDDGDTVRGWLTEEAVTGIMKKMIAVGGPQ